MVLLRGLGWLLLALALGAVVYDCLNWWSEGAFHLLAVGEIWSRLDLGSFDAVEKGLRSVLSGILWTDLLSPVLKTPALPTFVVMGVLCLWLSRRIGGRGADETSFLGMSRPRRRRSRGLS